MLFQIDDLDILLHSAIFFLVLFTLANTSDCLEIKRILEVYEKASGQKINMERSTIMFSLYVMLSNA